MADSQKLISDKIDELGKEAPEFFETPKNVLAMQRKKGYSAKVLKIYVDRFVNLEDDGTPVEPVAKPVKQPIAAPRAQPPQPQSVPAYDANGNFIGDIDVAPPITQTQPSPSSVVEDANWPGMTVPASAIRPSGAPVAVPPGAARPSGAPRVTPPYPTANNQQSPQEMFKLFQQFMQMMNQQQAAPPPPSIPLPKVKRPGSSRRGAWNRPHAAAGDKNADPYSVIDEQ